MISGNNHYMDEIVCPHCGHIHRDSWEKESGLEFFETECGECGEPMSVFRHIQVSYSTERVEQKREEGAR